MKYITLCLLLTSCASPEHMRKTLQNEHPDCFVTFDYEIICPDPYTEDEVTADFFKGEK